MCHTTGLTRGHLKKSKKFKKNKIKNSEKPWSDTWHTPGLTRVHLKKLKKNKKIKKIKRKIKKNKINKINIKKNHEVTCGSHC